MSRDDSVTCTFKNGKVPAAGTCDATRSQPNIEVHSSMRRGDNNYEFENEYDPETRYQIPFTKAEAKRVAAFHKKRGNKMRVTLVKNGKSKQVGQESI